MALILSFLDPGVVLVVRLRHRGLVDADDPLSCLKQLHELSAPVLALLDIHCCVHVRLYRLRPPPVPAEELRDLSDLELADSDSSLPLQLQLDPRRVD